MLPESVRPTCDKTSIPQQWKGLNCLSLAGQQIDMWVKKKKNAWRHLDLIIVRVSQVKLKSKIAFTWEAEVLRGILAIECALLQEAL